MLENDNFIEKPRLFKKASNRKFLIFDFASASNGWGDRIKGNILFKLNDLKTLWAGREKKSTKTAS